MNTEIRELSLTYNPCHLRRDFRRISIDETNKEYIITLEKDGDIRWRTSIPYGRTKTQTLKTIIAQMRHMGYKQDRYITDNKIKYLYK